MILHAGDIGSDDVMRDLQQIAPVVAIRGNVDTAGDVARLPDIESLKVNGQCIYMLHNLNDLDIDPVATGVNLVISGHSHQPKLTHTDGVIYINPGSIGPRRFRLPISMASLTITDEITAELIEITL